MDTRDLDDKFTIYNSPEWKPFPGKCPSCDSDIEVNSLIEDPGSEYMDETPVYEGEAVRCQKLCGFEADIAIVHGTAYVTEGNEAQL